MLTKKERVPLVSIGMPVYNGGPYIRQALDSLLAQDYKNFELIISDNASTDQTGEICREYAARDGRIQYYRNERNMGASWNFTRVLALGTGKYFMWAAHDDEWKPAFIKECVRVLDNSPDVVLCYSEAIIRNYNNQAEMLWPSDMVTVGIDKLSGIRKVLLNQLRNTEFYGLMRTQIAKRYSFRTFFGEDHVFVLFMALQGKLDKIEPGLFISGPGNSGSSPEKLVQALGIHRSQKYLGYLTLHIKMLALVLRKVSNLHWQEKIVVTMYIFERIFSPRFYQAIKNGLKEYILTNFKALKEAVLKKIKKIRV